MADRKLKKTVVEKRTVVASASAKAKKVSPAAVTVSANATAPARPAPKPAPARPAPTRLAPAAPAPARPAPAPAPARPAPAPAPARPAPAPAPAAAAPARPATVAAPLLAPVAPARPVEAVRPAVASGVPSAVKTVKPAPTSKGHGFKTHEHIVYPAHGVGQITAVEEQVVAGYKLELFVISFVKDKMILKVPLPKVTSVGMRKLAEPPVVKRALDTLTGRARIKRTMWSRRAQEYEAKINSGDLVAIAEVVRDLYRSDAQPEQSYSERQLYEAALDRIARELAVVQKLTDSEALKLIDGQLQKGPRRGKTDDAEVAGEDEAEEDVGIGAAA